LVENIVGGRAQISHVNVAQTASLIALFATCIQVYWRAQTYRLDRELIRHFAATRDLMEEVR